MADVTFPDVATILDWDPHAIESKNRLSVTLRRASSAVETIARLINNSILEEGNDEPVALSRKSQSGLLDALELVAVAMYYEVERADDAQRYRASPDE
ncbi:hypothetical protein [Paraburkholderia sp. CNPSo 3281]|uniref:hypothetical protein n=1 Tax=Paraburkholderia sp. CNPSo 3281 TaxID=2940933 RepID=UPI0020B89A71|nr:hypothetical protein [Paraburkholderia sp. CNPSo 3281]MCP3714882.1 hypothetical protein [Paraburkholderia sp. CNPSo 3281]